MWRSPAVLIRSKRARWVIPFAPDMPHLHSNERGPGVGSPPSIHCLSSRTRKWRAAYEDRSAVGRSVSNLLALDTETCDAFKVDSVVGRRRTAADWVHPPSWRGTLQLGSPAFLRYIVSFQNNIRKVLYIRPDALFILFCFVCFASFTYLFMYLFNSRVNAPFARLKKKHQSSKKKKKKKTQHGAI